MEQWVGTGITIIGFVITVAVLWGKFSVRMDNIEKMQDKQNKYNADHFDKIGKLETGAAAHGQRLEAHGTLDDTRFGQLADTMKEVKDELIRGRESMHALREDIQKWLRDERKY